MSIHIHMNRHCHHEAIFANIVEKIIIYVENNVCLFTCYLCLQPLSIQLAFVHIELMSIHITLLFRILALLEVQLLKRWRAKWDGNMKSFAIVFMKQVVDWAKKVNPFYLINDSACTENCLIAFREAILSAHILMKQHY